VRYNVSENDGRRNGYGAFTVWTAGDAIADCDIYGNTIFVAPSAGGTPRAVRFNSPSTDFRFFDNLIVTTGGVPLLDVPGGQTGIVFQGNDYWSSGGAFSILWNGTTYASLQDWAAATGQEMDGATLVGWDVDPLLEDPGAGGTIGDADALASLAAYRLQPGSPMIDAGLDLAGLFGVDPGPHDFYGTPLPQGAALDIGAFEAAPCATPGAVGPTLRLAKTAGGTRLAFSWTDVAGATSYTVHWDLDPRGPFAGTAGSAPTGAPGLDIAMPAGPLLDYLVTGASDCGEGPLR
jgi:hypothetical protein